MKEKIKTICLILITITIVISSYFFSMAQKEQQRYYQKEANKLEALGF